MAVGMTRTRTSWDSWRAGAHDLDSGGLRLAGYDLGAVDAPHVLTFLHGYPSSSMDIAAVAELLGPGWRVLTIDFPGFGASAKPTDHTYSIHGCADAIERLWATAGITSTVLVGHDYGASVGQELLARRAEGALAVELQAMVWMNGGIYPDLHRPTAGQQLLLDDEHGAELAASLTDELFVAGVKVTWGTRREMDDVEIHEMWRSMDERGGRALMHDLLHYVGDRRVHEIRWREALESNDLPNVFVWGDIDPVSGAHMIARVEERILDARIERMGDVGHWPLLEAPDVVARAIEEITPA